MNKWSAVVIIDGYILKAVGDGTEEGTVFSGRDQDIRTAKAAIRHEFSIFLGSPKIAPQVKASYDSALGLTAALMGASYGDVILWRAPKDVLKFIEDYGNEHNSEKMRYMGEDK